MSFRIASTLIPMSAARYLEKAQRQIDHSLGALASGSRVVNAGDDAAGFAISEAFRGQLGGIRQAKFNAESAVGLVQTAEGGLNEQNNILIRLRELGVQAASDSVGDEERQFLNTEFQMLVDEFDRIARSTRYGAKQVLVGESQDYQFQVGAFKGPENIIRFSLDANTTAGEVGIEGLEITTKSDAIDTLSEIDTSVMKIAEARATFGAIQSRMQYAIDNLGVQQENIAAARGRIVDVDMAEEVSKLAQGQILQSVGTSVIAQANQSSQRALALLNAV